MPRQTLGFRLLGVVLGAAVLVFSGSASADPPSRVARMGYTSGAVSFSPSGADEWVRASINRPLANGDRLWVDADARAEIQDGGVLIRMGSQTSVSVLNLDERITQLQLTQGTLNIRVRRLAPSQVFEVDTPHLALTLRQAGDYRIAVDADGYATDVIVRQGQGEVLGEGAGYLINAQQSYRFSGQDLRDYELLNVPQPDAFDRWAGERDRLFDRATSARYVSRDVVGYQDLDANGTWRVDATYGNVWLPNRVASDWAPYRDGHWSWIDPWGWTWIDDAPWGFAVSHYGRWANLGSRWAWVPGPARLNAYYAPALVVFVGGANLRLSMASGNVGGVAWFPLAPREVYRPAYAASRGYFENVNRSNTVVNNTIINNFYNTTNVTQVVYANRNVTGAVVAVPTTTFVRSQPVAQAVVRVDRNALANATLGVATHVAPTVQSVRGPAVSGVRPPPRVFEQQVVARSAPPAVHVGFVAQPVAGHVSAPLDTGPGQGVRREATVQPRPAVKVLNPTTLAPPKTLSAELSASRPAAAQPAVVHQPVRPAATPAPAPAPIPAPMATPPQRIKLAAPVAVPGVAASLPAPAVKQPEPAVKQPESTVKQPEPRAPVATPRPPLRPLPVQAGPGDDPASRAQQRGRGEHRTQQLDPATPAPLQRPTPPKLVPPQPVAVPPPVALPQPVKVAPVARPVEQRPPVAVKPAPEQVQPVPQADRRGQRGTPAASKPNDAENARDAARREQEGERQRK